jgi:hypothetical protein
MIYVSNELKEAFNPQSGGREIDYAARFEVINAEAQRNASFAANSYDGALNRTDRIFMDIESLDFASFEGDGFRLDGSMRVPPKAGERPDLPIGYVSEEISGANGNYRPDYRNFWVWVSPAADLSGFTIYWGHFIPEVFYVIWRGADMEVIHIEQYDENTSNVTVVNKVIAGVHNILVSIEKSAAPRRRIRVAGLKLGATVIFDKSNAEEMRIQEVIDPFSERAPASSLYIRADNIARAFDIVDPAGVYAHFRERMPIHVSVGARMENNAWGYVGMGTYYLRAPKLGGNMRIFEIEAVSGPGLLADLTYYPMTYWEAGGPAISFWDILILSQIQNGVKVWGGYWPNDFSMTTQWYIPRMTYAELFQKIAQASCSVVATDREGKIAFRRPAGGAMQAIDEGDYSAGGGISIADDDIINTVHVEYYQYNKEEDWTEIARAEYAGLVTSVTKYGDHSYVYGTAGEMHIMHPYSSGYGYEVMGGQFILRSRLITQTVKRVTVTNRRPDGPEYAYAVSGNPFITDKARALAVAAHALTMKSDKRRNVEIIYRGYPYIVMADILSFGYGGVQTPPFYVTENTLTLSGGGMSGILKAREM